MEANAQVMIGKENYFLSADGLLMPTKKNQAPPDVRIFQSNAKVTRRYAASGRAAKP